MSTEYPTLITELQTIIVRIQSYDSIIKKGVYPVGEVQIQLTMEQINILKTKRNEHKTRKDEICDIIKAL